MAWLSLFFFVLNWVKEISGCTQGPVKVRRKAIPRMTLSKRTQRSGESQTPNLTHTAMNSATAVTKLSLAGDNKRLQNRLQWEQGE
ncbi:hypothetical protein SLE2022_165640 [Rubroshorea leprosula]